MIKLILERFWPVFIPALAYAVWVLRQRRRAERQGLPVPKFSEGKWWWIAVITLVALMACFVWLGLTEDQEQGSYIPPHMEGGRIVPGTVVHE